MTPINIKKLKLPDSPGVYLFKDKKGRILYIGKATSLKSRVQSYFRGDISVTRGAHIAQMVLDVMRVDFEKSDSVLEALLLEASLIKKHRPRYNTDGKDDKSWNHVVMTKEAFPRVLLVRGKELAEKTFNEKILASYGPFPHGGVLKEAMRIIRRIFPYRDKCEPCEEGKSCKPCFNAQIRLCPGTCSGAMSKDEYKKTIRNLRLFFEGKKKILLRKLEKEMKTAAKNLEFEKAGNLKRTIFSLTHIQDVALLKQNSASGVRAFRIEAYDIAHISGTSTVGAMVVVKDGMPDKSSYRRFKIKRKEGVNDTAHLEEVLNRRFGHHEWEFPKLIVIDGGVAQKNRAEKTLAELDVPIPVVSVVKNERHRAREILGDKNLTLKHEKDILLANAEAHRFTLAYHRNLRGKFPR